MRTASKSIFVFESELRKKKKKLSHSVVRLEEKNKK